MKNQLLLSIVATSAMFVAGCSSSPTVKGYEKDQVLSTAGDKSMPDWAETGETQPFRVVDGKVYSVGITQIRGDERPEAGARVATNAAFANVSKHVENKMEFILQSSEENFSYESTAAKYIGSEVSSITSNEYSNEGIWWKRYAQSQEDGSRRIFYRIYSLVTLPEATLKQAVYAAVHKGSTQHQLSASFQKQVDRQWSRFVEGDTNQVAAKPMQDERKPSSDDSKSE